MSLAIAACGDDELEPETHNITGVDFAFEDVPDEVAVGSDFTLTNESDVEVHEIVLVRLPDDEERSVSELVQLPPEELFPILEPGAIGVNVAPPLEDGMVVEGDMTVNEPGRYAMLCMIPIGADPDEFMAAAAEGDGPPDVDGGPPHVAEGMYAEFTAE